VVPPRPLSRREFISTTNKRVGKLSKLCSKYQILRGSKLSDDGESTLFRADSGRNIAKPIQSARAGLRVARPDLFQRPIATLKVAVLA
jgi:hypothetical protein